jgi:SAM-dependent methyltransferase
MDKLTLKAYMDDGDEFIRLYEMADGPIHLFPAAFNESSRVLDIGCGSGRNMRSVQKLGVRVDGVDPCAMFVNHTVKKNTQFNSEIKIDALPELSSIGDQAYDGVLCSAVLMHLPEEELFDSVFSIRRILKEKGRALISIPHPDATIDPETQRDGKGRLFNGISPGQLELLFERVGFRLLHRSTSDDGLKRTHRKWENLLFELGCQNGARPIDTIESVLSKDNKVATYKLALFRSLAEIAVTNYKVVEWEQDGRVKVPLTTLAEKWVEYYWPIIESEQRIPQTTGKPIAFRKQLEALVDYYRSRGGLSAYTLDYRGRTLTSDATRLSSQLHSKLKNTI